VLVVLFGSYAIIVRGLGPSRSRSVRLGLGRDRSLGAGTSRLAPGILLAAVLAANLAPLFKSWQVTTPLVVTSSAVLAACYQLKPRLAGSVIGVAAWFSAIFSLGGQPNGLWFHVVAVVVGILARILGEFSLGLFRRDRRRTSYLLLVAGTAEFGALAVQQLVDNSSAIARSPFVSAAIVLVLGVAVLPDFTASVIGAGILASTLSTLAINGTQQMTTLATLVTFMGVAFVTKRFQTRPP
jgi:hypothetical protein